MGSPEKTPPDDIMSSLTPRIRMADDLALPIRTYGDISYADSEPDSNISDLEATDNDVENAEGEEIRASIAEKLRANQSIIDSLLDKWSILDQSSVTADAEQTNVVLIRKPTASGMVHGLLNPYIYRQIQSVGTLHNLAKLLDCPADWESQFELCYGKMKTSLTRFMNMDNRVPESSVQCAFMKLVICASNNLGLDNDILTETPIIVGGLLARYKYDLRSNTDPHFANIEGHNLLASEVKTESSFPKHSMWYHGSRGIEVLSAMYAFNCPTLLLTQKQWKLFVENHARDTILTYPFGDEASRTSYVNSTRMLETGSDFLKVIVICLLSQRMPAKPAGSSAAFMTPLKANIAVDSKHNTMSTEKTSSSDGQRATRKSARLESIALAREKAQQQLDSCAAIVPSFISGYLDGEPIRSVIRVISREAVECIENDLHRHREEEKEEKALDAGQEGMAAKLSESTLADAMDEEE